MAPVPSLHPPVPAAGPAPAAASGAAADPIARRSSRRTRGTRGEAASYKNNSSPLLAAQTLPVSPPSLSVLIFPLHNSEVNNDH